MATVTTTTGAFSGIDTAGIIDKLMAIEQKPLDKLNQKKEDYQTEISAYGEISSVVSALRTAVKGLASSKIASFDVTSSDETILQATAGVSASAGNYSIEVTQLAQDQKISSNAYSSDKEVFKTGTLTLRLGASSVDIDINYKNNTLSGIKDAINSAGIGASATIIKDSTGYRLVVSSKDSGASGGVTIVGNDGGPTGKSLGELDFDAEFSVGSMTLTQQGRDAIVKIDGQSISSSSNTLTDVISGLTINLKKASPGTKVALSVETGAMSESTNIKAFVDSYNSAMSKLKELSAKGESLSGDRTTRSIMLQLQRVTTSSYAGSTLAQFGISHDKYGVMELESSKLDSTSADKKTEFNAMMDNLSSEFDTTLQEIVRSLIPEKTNTLSKKIRYIEDDVLDLTASLAKTRELYQKKFAAMEATIADLQSQSTSMANMLPSTNK
ncbi:MAG: flagellar filament capping protein FliD [Nitrospirae bacterium]|uniref:flagellar filament capping protein FliD n=1 Tax=Candidatus Magnetobacterium casense TaxID=1455061 RepID=UPI00058BD5F5|nr:flagellar filament capping protein FliD [Candidatus Magnetobacterium casensis]MBF0336258.1 flagellar filament capping protein FliD [Nitrospirota bacterium]